MPAPAARKLPDRKALIARLKQLAKKLDTNVVTWPCFERHSGITRYQVYRHFNSYTELVREAGLTTHAHNRHVRDDELMRAMAETFRKTKGLVSLLRFGKVCPHSVMIYQRRWNGWSGALQAFRLWQVDNDPDFPYGDQIDRFRARGRVPRNRKPLWAPSGGRQYGEALNFRGLLHAPVNEQGVLFLFATLAVDLGFLIEGLTVEFPDCEAKRRAGKAWERVRIEFEYQSRNFRNHRHDPKGCDLIVCWEHNWDDCPIEVLALKPLVEGRLEAQPLQHLRSTETPPASVSTAYTGGRLGPERDAADGTARRGIGS